MKFKFNSSQFKVIIEYSDIFKIVTNLPKNLKLYVNNIFNFIISYYKINTEF